MAKLAVRSATKGKPELLITRILDAPRDLVFRMWSEPQHLRRWSAPRGFTIPKGETDFRPGGAWSCTMCSPEGMTMHVQGIYREIIPNERLVFTHGWLDDDGKSGPETVVTVNFADHGKQTKLTFHQTGFDSIASRDGHEFGWTSALELLEEYLATLQ